MEMLIAIVMYFVMIMIITFAIDETSGRRRFIIILSVIIIYVVTGVCGTYKGKRDIREEAVANGVAKWVVTIDPVTGKTTDREFEWIPSKPSKEKGEE